MRKNTDFISYLLAKSLDSLPVDHETALFAACVLVFNKVQEDDYEMWKHCIAFQNHNLARKIISTPVDQGVLAIKNREYIYSPEERKKLEGIPEAVAVFPSTASQKTTLACINQLIKALEYWSDNEEDKKEWIKEYTPFLEKNVVNLDFNDTEVDKTLKRCCKHICLLQHIFRLLSQTPPVLQEAWVTNSYVGHFPSFRLDREYQIQVLERTLNGMREKQKDCPDDRKSFEIHLSRHCMWNYTKDFIRFPVNENTAWTGISYRHFVEEIRNRNDISMQEMMRLIPDQMTNTEVIMGEIS